MDLSMAAGNLRVCGKRGQQLVSVLDHERGVAPRMEYREADGYGVLKLSDPPPGSGRHHTADWTVCFDDRVPLDLHVQLGNVDSNLRLDNVDLHSLDLQLGSGDTNLYLAGARWRDAKIDIVAGSGNMNLRIAQEVGVVLRTTPPDRHDDPRAGHYQYRRHSKAHHGRAGDLDLDDLRATPEGYVNEAYGRAPSTLYITLRPGAGDIDVATY